MNTCICWGFWAPIHVNHLKLFKESYKIANGGKVIVFINDDKQLYQKKKGLVVINENDRKEIIESIKWIDEAYIIHSIDQAKQLLIDLQPKYMCMGGDKTPKSPLEDPKIIDWSFGHVDDICNELNIEVLYGVGGFIKDRSSTDIINNIINWIKANELS